MNIEYIQCKLLMTPFLSYKIDFVQVFVVYAYTRGVSAGCLSGYINMILKTYYILKILYLVAEIFAK